MARVAKPKKADKPEKAKELKKVVLPSRTHMEMAADKIIEDGDFSGLIKFLLSDVPITRDDREEIAALLGHGGGWRGIKVVIERGNKGMPNKRGQRMRLHRYVRAIMRAHDGEVPPLWWEALASHFKRSVKTMKNAYAEEEQEQRRFFAELNEQMSKMDVSRDD